MEFLELLNKTRLFEGLDQAQLEGILRCLNAKTKDFCRGQTMLLEGELASRVGIILSGEVVIQKLDYNGNANLVSTLRPTEIIAASVCFSTENRLPFDVISASATRVLFLDASRLAHTCKNSCPFHAKLIDNLLRIIADKNLALADKIDILTKRTIRESLLSFLYTQAVRAKSARFSLPMNRRQLADFLSVNRSALSRELSQLRSEGILDFDKNRFHLKHFQNTLQTRH